MKPILLDHDPIPDPRDVDFLSGLTSLLGRTRLTSGKVSLLPGLDLVWSVPLDCSCVEVEIRMRGIAVWSATLDADGATQRLTAHQGLFKEDLELEVDLARGELTVSGDVCFRAASGWQCYRFPRAPLAAWSPMLGAVGGKVEAHPPRVNDPNFGQSSSIVPTITRIPVDTVQRAGTPVGAMVKRALFPDDPDFLFNVCFAVGPFKPFFPGTYGDPTSVWFNVFAGYYEIDCPKPAWGRPFGYKLTTTGAEIHFHDLVRIAKADWNLFSNWMYGVPEGVVELYLPPDRDTRCQHFGRRQVGSKEWDLVDVDGFSVVSAYQSDAPGAAQLVENTPLTPLWRLTYGEPHPRPGHDESFPGTNMRARLLMAFAEDAETYRTYLFGGTINKAFGEAESSRLLDRQMAAVQAVITEHYSDLGFPL
jgi:hypothetical protein